MNRAKELIDRVLEGEDPESLIEGKDYIILFYDKPTPDLIKKLRIFNARGTLKSKQGPYYVAPFYKEDDMNAALSMLKKPENTKYKVAVFGPANW